MFHADSSILEVIGQSLIAGLFLWAGVFNSSTGPRRLAHYQRLAARGWPLPWASLSVGFGLQIVGGTMVLVDWNADLGAIALIVFTLAAQLTFHNFWNETEPVKRFYHRLIFINNFAVTGGLVLIAEPVAARF